MRESLKEFFPDTDAIHFYIALRRDLAVYLTYWLGEAVFAGGDETHIRPHCIFPACQMAFGERLALVPALYSYLCTKLQAAAFLVWLGLPMNRSSVKLSPGLRKKAFDFGVSRDSTRAGLGRHYSLTNVERSWLFNIRVGTMVYRRHLFVDIQPYVPSRFAMQFGFSQGIVGAPSSKVKRFGGFLKDQDVIRSGAAQEIPDEVLEQLAEEEAEVAAWIQAVRAKASMESTGKSRPSGEEFARGQISMAGRVLPAEASGDDDELPEKRSRGEETVDDEDDGLMMPEVPADEAVTDPIVASKEELRDSEVDPESPPADLPEDSDDFEPSMDATFDDASDELMEAESIPPVVEEGCEVTEEVPLSFSEPEQGVPVTDLGVGASSTSFDEAEARPPIDIPSPAAPVGKSFLITLPTVLDTGSRPTEHGESSSEPSRQFARKVLKRVLSLWVETLSSGHLEAGFGMVKHVQDILADSEEVGLDITDAKAFC
ncbi:hypothetical protein AAC387_Pa07g2168 [Persea americana]